jgi:hypothetical protein
MADTELLEDRLRLMGLAYKRLVEGSESLLELNSLSQTEKLLLKLVSGLYRRRLSQLPESTQVAAVLPDERPKGESLALFKESMMEAAVEAALGGHDLGQWEHTESGYQAGCKLCQATTWVGGNGLRYTLLEDSCPGREGERV